MNIFQKVTLKTLNKNKTRTFVTIIGIILSAAMITAVTTFITSLQHYMLDAAIYNNGDWHGHFMDVSTDDIEGMKANKEITQVAVCQNIGYAALEGGINKNKPYIFIMGANDMFMDNMPIHLTSGRLPENANEIILPKHIKTNGGVYYAMGDTLSLSIGERMSEGYALGQSSPYLNGEDGETEELAVKEQRTYTVVGFYERPSFEDYSAPGYTAITVIDASTITSDSAANYDIYFKMENPKDVYAYAKSKMDVFGCTVNDDVLMYSGASKYDAFYKVLYHLAAVLIALIMFGSISLIYNAFSISVSERTKQFGLLSSVGATKRQIKKSVIFEALFVSAIGIPLGIVSGIVGIGVTLHLTSDSIASYAGVDIPLALSVSFPAVLITCVIALATVLISAWIPSKRATKVTAIEAIRQSSDITIKAKQVKTSKLLYKLFGLEGMLAQKYYKRNKKKYRATVISLFMSVVLFISASSFCAYLTKSVGTVAEKASYDVSYTMTSKNAEKISMQELYTELSGVSGVTKAAYVYNPRYSVNIASELVNQDYITYCNNAFGEDMLNTDSGEVKATATVLFIDNATYREYLKKNSLDETVFMNTTTPQAVVIDEVKFYNGEDGKYHTFHMLNSKTADMTANRVKEIEGYTLDEVNTDKDGNPVYTFKNAKGETIELPEEKALERMDIHAGAAEDDKPFMAGTNDITSILLLYPYDAIPAVLHMEKDVNEVFFCFQSKAHKATFEKMYSILETKGLSTESLHDFAQSVESERAMINVVNVFSYGFIVLISLIAAANVFNTISTNISLRRREFAMLKSIGMTRKGFYKMMNYECLLYGLKGLMYGIPVSIGVTYLIFLGINGGLETGFFIPWYSVAVAVGSVFVVVFSTMLYSMRKIQKDNPIDALKNENL